MWPSLLGASRWEGSLDKGCKGSGQGAVGPASWLDRLGRRSCHRRPLFPPGVIPGHDRKMQRDGAVVLAGNGTWHLESVWLLSVQWSPLSLSPQLDSLQRQRGLASSLWRSGICLHPVGLFWQKSSGLSPGELLILTRGLQLHSGDCRGEICFSRGPGRGAPGLSGRVFFLGSWQPRAQA